MKKKRKKVLNQKNIFKVISFAKEREKLPSRNVLSVVGGRICCMLSKYVLGAGGVNMGC